MFRPNAAQAATRNSSPYTGGDAAGDAQAGAAGAGSSLGACGSDGLVVHCLHEQIDGEQRFGLPFAPAARLPLRAQVFYVRMLGPRGRSEEHTSELQSLK